MEFPRSNQTPGFHPGSVNQGAFSVPNSNPRPSDFFGRKGNLEAGSQGVMTINAIDLGSGGDDARRGFKPISVAPGGVSSNLSYGQGNYSGVTGVNAADSDIMLSLDDILNDLQKKVVSGNNDSRPPGFGSVRPATQENVHRPLEFVSGRPTTQENVHGALGFGSGRPSTQENLLGALGSGRPTAQENVHGDLEFGSGRPTTEGDSGRPTTEEDLHGPLDFDFGSGRSTTQENVHGGGVADLPERNEQTIGGITVLHDTERNKAPYGVFFSIPGLNEQYRGESVGSHNQHEGEVAGPQGQSEHQQDCEVVHLQVANEPSGQYNTNEHHNEEAAVFQGEGTSVSPHANDKSKGELAASAGGIHVEQKVELPEPVGTNDQEKAEGVERVREAENLQQSVSEMVGGGELQPFVSTPKRGRLVSRKPVEIIDSPDWLPKGWCTEQRTREAGSSAGTKDKYYYDPVSQRRFRSKTEVLSYLETGKVGRYKSKIKPEADVSRKRNTSEVLLKNLNSLDPNIRPTKVRWVYDDFNSSWIPFVDEKDLNGYNNNKEGEHNFDLNHNSGDACKE